MGNKFKDSFDTALAAEGFSRTDSGIVRVRPKVRVDAKKDDGGFLAPGDVFDGYTCPSCDGVLVVKRQLNTAALETQCACGHVETVERPG